MEFPSKYMTTAQLSETFGLPQAFWRRYAHIEGQTCVMRMPGGKKFVYDTDELKKLMRKFPVR